MRRFHLLYTLPLVVLLAAWAWPFASGQETLILRDVLHSHYPLKVAHAAALGAGDFLPLVDPFRSFGQPLLGNLNALPLYPTSLLLLVASPLWVLNAHFWIHWLLAPLAGYWLGRAWGLGRPAAITVGAAYATGGFFLSLMNLYNLVAGAALAPAFVAAALDAAQAARGAPSRRRRAALAGALWALLLLAGDPLYALLAAAMAAAAVVVRQGLRVGRPAGVALAVAAIAGTAVALPQIVAMARILPLSFRGHFRYSPSASLAQSWDPRTLLEWVLPLAFGSPDLDFWGERFHGGNVAFLLSLHPGLVVLVLVAVAGWRRRAARWAWGLVAASVFFALGVWNPIVLAVVRWQDGAVVRYPVKLWLPGAVGLALLAGVGLEAVLAGRRRRLATGLFAAATAGLALLAVLLARPSVLDGALALVDPARLAPGAPERLRWVGLATSVGLVAALGTLLFTSMRRRPELAAGLLALHVASQLVFLSPLLLADEATHYRRPPALLGAVPLEARLAHGAFHDLFGPPRGALPRLPEHRRRWLERLYQSQAQPFAGIPWGRRYAMNAAPEGLDSFYAIALERRLPGLADLERVRLLAASGVDVLLLDRELDPPARAAVRLLGRDDTFGRPTFAYGLAQRAPTVRVVGAVRRAPHLNAAVAALVDPGFDPSREVILPGQPEGEAARPPGRVLEASETTDGFRLEVDSPAGGWVVVERAYLDLYRATVDGREAPLQVADGQLMALAIAPGRHRVEILADRRPTRRAAAVAAVGALVLAGLAFGRRERPR